MLGPHLKLVIFPSQLPGKLHPGAVPAQKHGLVILFVNLDPGWRVTLSEKVKPISSTGIICQIGFHWKALWQAAIFALSVGVELRVKENVASLKLQRKMEDIYNALIQNSSYSNICTLSVIKENIYRLYQYGLGIRALHWKQFSWLFEFIWGSVYSWEGQMAKGGAVGK